MDDTNLDISITADSSGAVSAFDGLDNSVGAFGQQMTKLSEAFTKPLEHVAVQIFGKELLSVIGIAGEARPVLMVLQTAVTQLGGAFGFLTGPVGLMVMGLGALAAVIYKVVESDKAHAVSIEQVISENQKQYDGTTDLSEKLDTYKTKVGHLSPVLEELAIATKKVNEENRFALLQSEGQQLINIDATIRAKRDLIAANEAEIKSNIEEGKSYSGHIESGELVEQVNNKLAESNARLTIEIDKENKARIEIKANIAAQAKGYKDAQDQMEKLGKASDDIHKKESELSKKSLDEFLRNEDAKRRAMRESMSYTQAIINSKFNMEIAALHGVGMENAVASETVRKAWGDAYLGMMKGAGDSFASMIVDGKDFGESMTQVYHNILKSFISMLSEMLIRWLVVRAIMAAGGGGAFAAFDIGTQAAGHATGFDGVVSSPMMFTVGDGGEPEHVRITPQSQMQIASMGSGGGSTINVSVVNNIGGRDTANDRSLADQIGKQVVARIRGLGDINFSRG